MASTLLLDATWDLTVDASGNIALAEESPAPANLAQDAASAIRTYRGECYWDTTVGVAWNTIFGKRLNLPLLKQQLVDAALTVPDVASAVVYISGFTNRQISGQVQVVSGSTGTISAANFVVVPPQGA